MIEGSRHVAVRVTAPTEVAVARRVAASLAGSIGFDETTVGRLFIVVTEAGTNMLKHAAGGEILLSVHDQGVPLVQVIALDRGPGMTDVARSLRDGYSTAGSAGTGLGAIARLATTFDIYSRPGGGTGVLAQVAEAPRTAGTEGLRVGGISVALAGEEICGDDWAEERRGDRLTLMVVDGLGHGRPAAEASRACVAAFRAHPGLAPAARVEAIHEAARATRGAAVAVAEVDAAHGAVRFAGLGNIGGLIHSAAGTRHMVSQNGTAGHVARRFGEYIYPWSSSSILVMHSDGLTSRQGFETYPGLPARHPALIAGVLYRDFSRGRDDVTVVVAQDRPT